MRARIMYELRLLVLALGFLTRLPVPAQEHSDARLAASVSYFPAVGWVVGLFGALGFHLGLFLGSSAVAAVLAMTAMVLVAGGFHEDGLADTADGFGGGWTRQRKLEIMKDSRLGSYGALALVLSLLLVFSVLQHLEADRALLVFCLAQALARWTALPLLRFNDYVRADSDRPGLVAQVFSNKRFWLGTVFAWLPVAVFAGSEFSILLVAVCLLMLLWQGWCRRQIGGVTGDTLGAVNKLTEIVVYICVCL